MPANISNRRHRHAVTQFKVRLWYACVSSGMANMSAYGLENYFEPLDIQTTDERTPFRNKWSRYMRGENTPRKQLLKKVERDVPNTQVIIEHLLWRLLEQPEIKTSEKWTALLPSEIRSRVDACFVKDGKKRIIESKYSSRLTYYLAIRTSLDTLFALTILWACSSKTEVQQGYAAAIYQALLIFFAKNDNKTLATELFLIFKNQVFLATDQRNVIFELEEEIYERNLSILKRMLDRNKNAFASTTSVNSRMLAILNGKFGLGLSVLLRPIWHHSSVYTKEEFLQWLLSPDEINILDNDDIDTEIAYWKTEKAAGYEYYGEENE